MADANDGGGKGLLNKDVVGDDELGLKLSPWLKPFDGKGLSKPLPGELLAASLLELRRGVKSMIPPISSRFVSSVSSGSLEGSGGGTGPAFCFPFTFPRLEWAWEVGNGFKEENEVDVNDADGSKYGMGGVGEEKLPLLRSGSTASRLRLRFLMMRGIRLKDLAFFESTVFPG
jgi:hypothetical protein